MPNIYGVELTITGVAPEVTVNGVAIDATNSDIPATNGMIQGLMELLDVPAADEAVVVPDTEAPEEPVATEPAD